MNISNKYILDGLTINGNHIKGYTIFTIKTQHFHINSLDELTNERVEEEIKKQQYYENYEKEMFRIFYRTIKSND